MCRVPVWCGKAIPKADTPLHSIATPKTAKMQWQRATASLPLPDKKSVGRTWRKGRAGWEKKSPSWLSCYAHAEPLLMLYKSPNLPDMALPTTGR